MKKKNKLTKGELLELQVHVEKLYKYFGLSESVYKEIMLKIDALYPKAENIFE